MTILLVGIVTPAVLNAQAIEKDQSQASLLYEILRLQVLGFHPAGSDSLQTPADVRQNICEAKSLAAGGDFVLANVFLENILDYFQNNSPGSMPPFPTIIKSNPWSFELFSGSDIWQQRFGITLGEQDSSIYESRGNPFGGFRISYDRAPRFDLQTRSFLQVRTSHEYISGQWEFTHTGRFYKKSTFTLSNRLDNTRYQQQKELSYWQNLCAVGITAPLAKQTQLGIDDEWQIRRYAGTTGFFSSYGQNQIGLRLSQNWTLLKPELRVDYRVRKYRTDQQKNYHESMFSLYIWPDILRKTSLTAAIQARQRRYASSYVDSLFNNHFFELGTELGLKTQIATKWLLRLNAEFNSRRYKEIAAATPDFSDLVLEPSLTLQTGLEWAFKAGYRFRKKDHSNRDAIEASTVSIENFIGHGPLISIDLFTTHGLMISLADNFEWRHYPQAPSSGISLYSNRIIHSLFLFATWSLTRHWEFSTMASIDQEDDRNVQGADSRSNIFNFELYYKF